MRLSFAAAAFAVLVAAISANADDPELWCDGAFEQGGFAICSVVGADEVYRFESSSGSAQGIGINAAFIPFDRDHGDRAVVRAYPSGMDWASQGLNQAFDIAPREWNIEEVNVPPSKVQARTEAEKAKAAADWKLKQEVWKSRAPGAYWLEGFDIPVKTPHRISGVFGSQRILNGEPRRPHYGLDYARVSGTDWEAFIGTNVYAPAGGTIIMANPDMYYEGGFIVLDHGAGVMSLFMHLARLDVAEGEVVKKGDLIGGIGNTGRSSGPHLHWGLRVQTGAESIYVDPQSLLDFDATASAAVIAARAALPR